MAIIPPQVPGPAPGLPGHFAHTDWLTASVVALDAEQSPSGIITSIASIITMSADWTCQAAMAARSGRWVEVALSITYTGAAIVVPADGNIANSTVGTLAAQWRPPTTRGVGASMSVGSAGRLAAFSANAGGAVQLAAVGTGGNVTTNSAWAISGVWAVA